MSNSFYSEEELQQMNFKYIGKNVLVSRKASIYGIENISIDDNSRIDDFCILSGNITIGKNVHIAAACLFFSGDYNIVLEDYSGVSSQTTIYASSDDYSGDYLTNPTVPDNLRNVTGGDVIIKRHVVVGSGTTILPNVTIGVGCSVGAKSLITKDLDDWGIYFGIPAKFYKKRSKLLLDKEKELNKDVKQ